MKKHHSKLLPALQAFDCTECEQTFMNNRQFLVHMRTEHLNQWYKCDVCGKDFGRKDSYTTHLLFVHSKPCKLCDFKGSSSDQLKKHMKSHKLECDICHFSTYDHVKFVRHMTTKHQACNNCPFVAENRTEFKKHNCFKRIKKSVVEMQPPIKESKVLQNVETQPPKESEETNVLQCKFCSYQATKEAFLNMHLKNIHKSDKDYEEYTDDPMDDFYNLPNENQMIKENESDTMNNERIESVEQEFVTENVQDNQQKLRIVPTNGDQHIVENDILSCMDNMSQVTCKSLNLQIFPVKRKAIPEKEPDISIKSKLSEVDFDFEPEAAKYEKRKRNHDGPVESTNDNILDANGTKEKECPQCGFSTKDEELHQHHLVTDHLLCYLCGFTSEYQYFIFSHMKAIHNILDFEEEEEENRRMKSEEEKKRSQQSNSIASECPICSEKFESKASLQKHNLKVHKEQSFECGTCGVRFRNFKSLVRHYAKIHNIIADSNTVYAECLVK